MYACREVEGVYYMIQDFNVVYVTPFVLRPSSRPLLLCSSLLLMRIPSLSRLLACMSRDGKR